MSEFKNSLFSQKMDRRKALRLGGAAVGGGVGVVVIESVARQFATRFNQQPNLLPLGPAQLQTLYLDLNSIYLKFMNPNTDLEVTDVLASLARNYKQPDLTAGITLNKVSVRSAPKPWGDLYKFSLVRPSNRQMFDLSTEEVNVREVSSHTNLYFGAINDQGTHFVRRGSYGTFSYQELEKMGNDLFLNPPSLWERYTRLQETGKKMDVIGAKSGNGYFELYNDGLGSANAFSTLE